MCVTTWAFKSILMSSVLSLLVGHSWGRMTQDIRHSLEYSNATKPCVSKFWKLFSLKHWRRGRGHALFNFAHRKWPLALSSSQFFSHHFQMWQIYLLSLDLEGVRLWRFCLLAFLGSVFEGNPFNFVHMLRFTWNLTYIYVYMCVYVYIYIYI